MKKSDGTYTGLAKATEALLGAGGYITAGVEIADDGWMICGGDAIGCWVKSLNAQRWIPLVTGSIMPAGYVGNSHISGAGDGVLGSWCVDICKSDSTRGWAVINGFLYKIDNLNNSSRGVTRISSGGPWSSTSSSDNNSLTPGRMRCDPQNKDVVAFGTRQNKLVVTTNGGTSITEVAVAAGNLQIQVDVDPTSTVTGGILQRWFCTQPGVGVLKSTTGPSGPYSLVSGSPLYCSSIHCDAQGTCWAMWEDKSFGLTGAPAIGATTATLSSPWTGPSGTLNASFRPDRLDIRAVTFTNGSTALSWGTALTLAGTTSVIAPLSDNLYKWTSASGAFTKVSTTLGASDYGWSWIASDPATSGASQHLFLMGGSGIAQSFDGGSTWVGLWNQASIGAHTYVGPTSIKWQGTYPAGGSKAGANTNPWNYASWGKFTKTGGRLFCATGVGMMEAPTLPTAASSSSANTIRFYERSEGLDMLLSVCICYPPGGKPIYGTWDRLAIKINDRQRYYNQPNGYRYGEIDGAGNPYYSQLNHCSSLQYVPGHPNVIVASMWLNNQAHCVSYDFGDTWTKQISHPDGFSLWGIITPSDLDTAIWIPGANERPAYCTNLSSATPTFTIMSGSGLPFPTKTSTLIGSGTSQLLLRSAANYDGNTTSGGQYGISVTINAASGAGSVVDNAGAKTCVVTPPSGTTTATALATYINANSTLITAVATGTGAGAPPTGTAPSMVYESGFGHSPFDTGKRFMLNDANGNIILYNYGPGNEAATYRGIWVLLYGANPISGWTRVVSSAITQGDACTQIDFVPNGTSIPTEFYGKGYPFDTTNGLSRSVGGAAWSIVPLTSAVTTVRVGPVPPGKSRPAIAFVGKYNGVQDVWIWEGTTPGTDAPRRLIGGNGYPLDNPDLVLELCFNPDAYNITAADRTLLWGGFGTSGGFALTYADSKTLT